MPSAFLCIISFTLRTGNIANVVKTTKEFNRTAPSHLGNGLYLALYKGRSYKIQKVKSPYIAPYKGAGVAKKIKKTK